MAGHNKWTQIKRKKGAADAERSKLFGKLSKVISLESKKSSGKDSPGLRAAIDKAKAQNMPSENIERAVGKGGGGDDERLEPILYEAYGPGGAALLIEALTTNRNKAASEIKHILTEHGTNLGTRGSAAWAFKKQNGEWRPKAPLEITPEEKESLLTLLENLAESEEVQALYTNANLAD